MPNQYTPRIPLIDRLWSKVTKTSGCWEWTASTTEGYGRLSYKIRGQKFNVFAHRLSYEHYYGAIPDGLLVLHTCDNRRCVRPDHLYVGTTRDNSRDSVAIGRDGSSHLPHPIGEAHPRSLLTVEQVRQIRHIRQNERLSLLAIAKRFGISPTAVGDILRGRTWRHVE